MINQVDHFCPGCGAKQRTNPRYPWYFCRTCYALAQDGNETLLEFRNASVSGGLIWRTEGSEIWHDASAVFCLIHNRPVRISEAHFGGIIAEPMAAQAGHGAALNSVNLTRKT